MIGFILRRFIKVEWNRTPVHLYPAVEIYFLRWVIYSAQWNPLGNFWIRPEDIERNSLSRLKIFKLWLKRIFKR